MTDGCKPSHPIIQFRREKMAEQKNWTKEYTKRYNRHYDELKWL